MAYPVQPQTACLGAYSDEPGILIICLAFYASFYASYTNAYLPLKPKGTLVPFG
jgi:hypothetical protein